ncbi:MAG: hypothetical protein HY863_19685 [Chloroflexi bacterium]|nr:hypothetical protein [Chloroflexota bacterium]
MKKQIREMINRVIGLPQIMDRVEQTRRQVKAESEQTRLLLGKMLSNQVRAHGVYENIHDAEFQVFSQFGDDGILQYLIEQTRPDVEKFIEFGVQNYTEANTRFLLMNNNWSGLIIDGDPANMEFAKRSSYYWRSALQAVSQFVDRDNINAIFEAAGFSGEIGLLSVDIDGNDYWVWEAIHIVDPLIVTVEYNSVFGADHAITVPYNAAFYRTRAHYSNLFFGASLKALCLLAEKKGYAFVGSNSAGNNAHFVRKDIVGKIPVKTVAQGYVESNFSESRDKNGKSNDLRGPERLEAIKDMQVFDVENGKTVFIRDLFSLK